MFNFIKTISNYIKRRRVFSERRIVDMRLNHLEYKYDGFRDKFEMVLRYRDEVGLVSLRLDKIEDILRKRG